MTEPQEELLQIADRMVALTSRAKAPEISDRLVLLGTVADQVSKSWSGSALGYHAYVYYAGLQPKPPGAQFSPEWGLKDRTTGGYGDWREFDPDEVKKTIYQEAGNVDLTEARGFAKEAALAFESGRLDMLSVLTTELSQAQDAFLEAIKRRIEGLSVASEAEIANRLLPRGAEWSRDSLAITQGLRVPPHLCVVSEVRALQHTFEVIEELSILARRAGSQLSRQRRQHRKAETVGTNVFIGHGRSQIWRELKDFIETRLKLPADEFNRVPVAGVTNIARLSEMLDSAAIAFLIMSGEDEQPDGKLNARMNVVHEAGLFQGRLGFTRAIVMLEDGCEEFSNI